MYIICILDLKGLIIQNPNSKNTFTLHKQPIELTQQTTSQIEKKIIKDFIDILENFRLEMLLASTSIRSVLKNEIYS